jgi:hypothetical protein
MKLLLPLLFLTAAVLRGSTLYAEAAARKVWRDFSVLLTETEESRLQSNPENWMAGENLTLSSVTRIGIHNQLSVWQTLFEEKRIDGR